MVATNVKAEVVSLMDKRSALEAEMNSIISRLSQPGGPGLSGNLLDSEGFPRSDIDIPVVRAERRRLSELRNDYMETTDKINRSIEILHSARLVNTSSPFKNSGNNDDASNIHTSSTVALTPSQNVLLRHSPSSMDVDVLVSRPFAIVDEITDGSPAVEDGLQLGDQMLKFGNVEAGDNLLQKLSSEAQSNVDRAVPVLIMRQGTMINLTITPRTWQGRGLLGQVSLSKRKKILDFQVLAKRPMARDGDGKQRAARLASSGDGGEEAIDGKQRLLSIWRAIASSCSPSEQVAKVGEENDCKTEGQTHLASHGELMLAKREMARHGDQTKLWRFSTHVQANPHLKQGARQATSGEPWRA